MNNTNKKQKAKKRQQKKPQPPPKVWRKEGQPSTVNVQKLIGGKGQDINAPSNNRESLRQSMELATQTKVLPVNCAVTEKSVANMALGIVLHALRHGLAAATDSETTNPLYMYRYLTGAFLSAMQGVVPQIQQAPRWFWEIIYAIRKKQAPFKLSQVNYSWVITADQEADSLPIPMGVNPEAYFVYLTQSMSNSSVLGFPVLAPPPQSYTTPLGEAAIANLWAYCIGTSYMMEMIADPGTDASLYRDTSSFAVVYPELGATWETPNALKSTIYSERNIDSPLFSKFALYQPEGTENWRGWHKAGVTGGSSCQIGPTLMSMSSREELRSKVAPITKFYNFDEFYEVLSLTLAASLDVAYGKGGGLVSPCPLTPLQVQLLLRQTIICNFSNECCQDLRMSQSNTELILPFVVGQNGVSMGTNMLLPTFLAENIRACKSFSNRISRNNPRTLLRIYSVLGRPANKPQMGNYEANGFGLIYAVDPDNIQVNLIDCSYTSVNQTMYLDLTREEINKLTSAWNTWIVTLSTNLSPLIAIGQTDGVSVLKTLTLTNFQGQLQVVTPPVVVTSTPGMAKQHSTSKIVRIPGIQRDRVGAPSPAPGATYFDTITDRYTTSLQNILAPYWKYLSLWILPVTIAAPASLEEQSIQGWSAFFIETFRVPRTTSGGQGVGVVGAARNNVTAYDRHLNMAMVDVKAIASDGQNELISELHHLGEEGRGSFLEALASLVGPAINAIGMI